MEIALNCYIQQGLNVAFRDFSMVLELFLQFLYLALTFTCGRIIQLLASYSSQIAIRWCNGSNSQIQILRAVNRVPNQTALLDGNQYSEIIRRNEHSLRGGSQSNAGRRSVMDDYLQKSGGGVLKNLLIQLKVNILLEVPSLKLRPNLVKITLKLLNLHKRIVALV